MTVFHVVPTLRAALKAVEAGVDGLIVEGGEGGGFKNPQPVSSMVLLPLVRENVDVPIIAAGGIADGRTMAAAFALGAEGVQMGTRMVSAAESPVHANWKHAILAAAETDTVFLNQFSKPALRALRTEQDHAPGARARAQHDERVRATPRICISAATWRRASRCPGRSAGGSIPSSRSRRSSRETVDDFFATMKGLSAAYAA